MADYDIGAALKAIEDELIRSMMRNMQNHRVEEVENKKQWEMWQAKQLESLERYKKRNRKKHKGQFEDIDAMIDQIINQAYDEGGMEQEIEILNAIKKRYGNNLPSNARRIKDKIKEKLPFGSTVDKDFFQTNDKRLDALVHATTSDMEKAEAAMLRMAEDQYRKIIFNAQAYAISGAGTYEKAVDMATKDFLASGINCVEYKNGRRVNIKSYAEMAIRTADKRARLYADGEVRKKLGITTVITKKRLNACPKCLPFVDKILIDDVWSGGKQTDGSYPLLSSAMSAGFLHPNCKDHLSTYIPGITNPPEGGFSEKEIKTVEQDAKLEAEQQYAERQEEKFGRLAEYSLDSENKEQYSRKAEQWKGIRFKTGGLTSKEYSDSKRPLANFHAVPQSRVVGILRDASEAWIKLLTNEEKRAVRKYTYNYGDKKPNRFFERLNAMLRGAIPEDPKLKVYADTISAAVKKNKLKHDVIAYRGMDIDPSEGIPEGGLYWSKQFFSTSVIEKRSLAGQYKIIIYVKKGSNAAYIESLSHFKSQRELLLDKDCVYRVLSRKGNIIELEVI